MAKKQTFADKLTKIKEHADVVKCSSCSQESVVTYAKYVESKVSEKTGAWKFLERRVQLCGNCGTIVG
ncbi:MAG: hypothetical protein KDC45_07315 [Bacteroidetes bacterium]|nr:hypothetical protein [Bacteroidota bacterium]